MTRNTACTAIDTRTQNYSNRSHSNKKSIRARVRKLMDCTVEVLSVAAAWLYAACYVVLGLLACALVIAGFVVAWDVLIMCGDPTASWGPGGAYEIFWFCLDFIKWSVIAALAALVFFGGTRVLGVIFRDAYEGVYPVNKIRAKGYMVLAIIFFLPSVVLQAFIENAEEHFGTAQLIDLIIERI